MAKGIQGLVAGAVLSSELAGLEEMGAEVANSVRQNAEQEVNTSADSHKLRQRRDADTDWVTELGLIGRRVDAIVSKRKLEAREAASNS